MRPETIAKAKSMLVSVLQGGATYREAGAPYTLGRLTVERTIKALVLQVPSSGASQNWTRTRCHT